MPMSAKRVVLALAFAGFALAGCAEQQTEKPQAAAAVPDDDAYCQAKGFKPGSDPYVNCRKDRDHVASLREQQDNKDKNKIGDYMIDHAGEH